MWGTFFLAHFGSVILCERLLNTTLSIVADYVLKGASNELMCHVKKVKSPQTRFLTMTTKYSNVIYSNQSSTVPLGCDGTGDSHHTCANETPAAV